MKVCPVHQIEMTPQQTKYGVRFTCVSGCDMVCWDGKTATPADYPTRQARMVAHAAFDQLWKSGQIERQEAYNLLSEHLGLPLEETHIGMFQMDTIREVIRFSDALPLVLLKEKYK